MYRLAWQRERGYSASVRFGDGRNDGNNDCSGRVMRLLLLQSRRIPLSSLNDLAVGFP